MDATREIARFENRSVVEISTEGRIVKYCACTNYDESKDIGSRWDFGHYYDIYGEMTQEKALRAAMADLYNIDFTAIAENKKKLDRINVIAGRLVDEILKRVDEEDLPDLFLNHVGLTEDETDMFDIHELVFPKKFKIVEVNLSKEVRTTLMVAMPMDVDDDNVMDFIDQPNYIEPEDDTDDWEVDSVYVDEDNLDRDELKYKDIWNSGDIDDI